MTKDKHGRRINIGDIVYKDDIVAEVLCVNDAALRDYSVPVVLPDEIQIKLLEAPSRLARYVSTSMWVRANYWIVRGVPGRAKELGVRNFVFNKISH